MKSSDRGQVGKEKKPTEGGKLDTDIMKSSDRRQVGKEKKTTEDNRPPPQVFSK